MPKFKCTNDSCSQFEQEVVIANVRYIFDEKSKRLIPRSVDVRCQWCGVDLEEIKPESTGDINVCFASFRAKSDGEKRQILKKRADEHTRTKMKDKIHEIKKKFGTV